MSARALSAARVSEIFRRQEIARWGPDYEAAIRATREEAPGCSRASRVYSQELQRYINAISTPTKAFVALALYNPDLFELREEHVLFPEPRLHPLAEHPAGRNLSLPATTGTVAISTRLGLFTKHPKVWIPDKDPLTGKDLLEGGEWKAAAWIGDLLLFLRDDDGPYVVEWDVKAKAGDHGKPGPDRSGQPPSRRRISDAQARDRVYVEYLKELEIPLVRVALNGLPFGLRSTLISLMRSHDKAIDLPTETISELVWDFSQALEKNVPPNDVIDRHERHGVNCKQAKLVLEQAVWYRRIRVDLYRPLIVDQPLKPEVSDVVIDFADLFKRRP